MDSVVVLISADTEWQEVCREYQPAELPASPLGQWFTVNLPTLAPSIIFFHGGWGKVAAAASAQYAIDRWQPSLLLNLGTCGGLAGKSRVGEILLVEKTLIYDIYERMGDPAEALDFYTTELDLSFLSDPYPQAVRRSLLVSADQDIDPDLIHKLTDDFGAVAADWESGAIAWTARRNQTRCLILRGVSDVVDPFGGEIYDSDEFHARAEAVMTVLLKALPNWIRCAFWG